MCLFFFLPSADNEASHQEDEENDSPGDGHSQDSGLVRVPDSKHIYIGRQRGTRWINKQNMNGDKRKLRMFSAGEESEGRKDEGRP